MGRTLSVAQPNGSGTTTYAYTGNTVTVTDPGGKWKRMTMDGFGNLVKVVEPDPASPLTLVYTTNYSYSAFNQLLTVSMPRPTGTQPPSPSASFGGQGFGGQGIRHDDLRLHGRVADLEAGREAAKDGVGV
jgi:YD repeat-containing protein